MFATFGENLRLAGRCYEVLASNSNGGKNFCILIFFVCYNQWHVKGIVGPPQIVGGSLPSVGSLFLYSQSQFC